MAGKRTHWLTGVAAAVWAAAVVAGAAQAPAAGQTAARPHVAAAALFQPSGTGLACHNGLVTDRGEDVSIGADWRSSMMANSARDPYWMAAVRREIMDHPASQAAIEDECSICHMQMTTFPARQSGAKGRGWLLSVKQVHGTDALVVDRPLSESDQFLGGWEALVTDQPGVTVAVRTADCVPVLVHDPGRRVVAAIHAGWRRDQSGCEHSEESATHRPPGGR